MSHIQLTARVQPRSPVALRNGVGTKAVLNGVFARVDLDFLSGLTEVVTLPDRGLTIFQSAATGEFFRIDLARLITGDFSGQFAALEAADDEIRAIAEEALQTAQAGGGSGGAAAGASAQFGTRAGAVASTIPNFVNRVHLQGYYAVGDHEEDAIYIRAAQAPTTHDWYFQSADGAYWVFNGGTINVRMAGAKGDYNPTNGTGTDDSNALKRAFNFAQKTGFSLAPGPYSVHNLHGEVVYFPPGCYQHKGPIATPGLNGQDGKIIVRGDGANAVMVYNTTTGWALEGLQCAALEITGISWRGGSGCLAITQTASQVVRFLYVHRNEFADYETVAIGANSLDNPYWKIEYNKFNPGMSKYLAQPNGSTVNDATKYGCIALNGLCDQHEISNNEFLFYNSAIKLEAGNNAKVRNNFFAGAMVQSGHDIWFTPRVPQTDPNWGYGFLSEGNKYSFEGVTPIGGAPRWRFSRELAADAALPFYQRRYDSTAETTNYIVGLTSLCDAFYSNDYQQVAGLLYATLNLGGIRILDPMIVGTPPKMLMEYAPGASLTVGTYVRQNYIRLTNWVTSEVRGLVGTNYSEPVIISNRPELWFVDDPMGVAAGAKSAHMSIHGGDDPGYVFRNGFQTNGGGTLTDASGSGIADSLGRSNAGLEITFSTRTGSWISAAMGQHSVQAPGYVEIAVKLASSASLGTLNLWLRRTDGSGQIELARTVELTPKWALVRIPWVPSSQAGTLQLVVQPGDFVAGSKIRAQIANLCTYEARQPINHGHLRLGDMTWNGGHIVTSGDRHIWVNASGLWRSKQGAPTSDGDGAAVA